MAWISEAKWPYPDVIMNNPENISRDRHESKEHAICVCEMLISHGFGGNCVIFPISTRVYDEEDV